MTWRNLLVGVVLISAPVILPTNATAQTPTQPPTPPDDRKWFVELAAAGGGFAAVHEEEILVQDHLVCTGQTTPQTCTIDPNNQVLVRNVKYTYSPTLSTGIVFRRLVGQAGTANEDSFGVGVGGHFVFLSGADGTIKAAPAVTVHVGTQKTQLFGGVIFVNSDQVSFQNGASSVVVPKDADTSSLILKNHGRGPSFFLGVVIGGVSVTKPGGD